MTRSDLIKILANTNMGLPLHLVDKSVREVFLVLAKALNDGEHIEIRGFGTFSIRERGPRVARNPKTGEQIQISKKRYVHFKPGKELRERMNLEKFDLEIN